MLRWKSQFRIRFKLFRYVTSSPQINSSASLNPRSESWPDSEMDLCKTTLLQDNLRASLAHDEINGTGIELNKINPEMWWQVAKYCNTPPPSRYNFKFDWLSPPTFTTEWRPGSTGQILSDLDLTSQKEGRWKRINTLAHYNVSTDKIWCRDATY